MTYRLHPRVKSIDPKNDTHRAGSEHTYKTFLRTYDPSPEQTFDDPTPPGCSDFRSQLVMTDKCDLFCALMEGIVQEQGQALFGPGFSVLWVQYMAKPKSVLVTKDWVGKLKKHSLLRVTLPEGQMYIFDGSHAQYGWSSCLKRKDDYEARNAQSAADAGWRYPGFQCPFVVMAQEEKQEKIRTHKDYHYWKGVLDRLEAFVGQVAWKEYRHLPVDEVRDLIFPSVYDTFAETQFGADMVQT